MKKSLLTVLAAFAVTSMAFAGGAELSAYNKLSSDIVNIDSVKDGDTTTDFAGIKDTVYAEFLSEFVDGSIKVSSIFGTSTYTNAKGEESTCGLYAGAAGIGILDDMFSLGVEDYYIEFRPLKMVTVGFHDAMFTPGSYLPVLDDNVDMGNIGSDAVLVLRPIEGLRIAAGMDWLSYFGKEDADDPYLNFGADYTADAFAIGFACRDVINDFSFGAYGSLTAVENLVLNAGYAYNGSVGDVSGNLLSLGATYDVNALSLAGDFATNFGDENYSNDLYAAVSAGFAVTDAVNIAGSFSYVSDLNVDDSYVMTITAGGDYTFGQNVIGAEVDVGLAKNETAVCFPVYWKHTF